MELNRFMVLVLADQDAQTANRDLIFHAEELELIAVLLALQRQQIPSHLHHRVLPQGRPPLVQQGVSLAQWGIAGQTGPYGHRWCLYAVVALDGWWRWWWFGFPAWCRWPVSREVFYFGLKAGVYLQREVRGEEYLTLWTEDGTLISAVCFPHSLDAGETEVMSTWQCHRICEDVLADGTLKIFLYSPHSSARTCHGSSVCSWPTSWKFYRTLLACTKHSCFSVRLL